MREIKFRGYGKDKGQWIYGSLLDEKSVGIVAIQDEDCHVYAVAPETVGQYTGLKDSTGKEIYEGDVVAFSDYEGTTHKGKVYFRDGAFFITQPRMEYGYRLYVLVKLYYPAFVIGNVHDNPELIKK